MDRYKVNICGWYNHNNCGDEAYKIAFPIILPENFDITFTDKPIKSDIYILGGGDIVSNYFIDSFQKINAPKHIISTTIRNDINFKNLSQFSTILVRDYQSMKILNDNNILSKYCPDATFALTPNVDNGKKIIKDAFNNENAELYENIIVITINGHLCPEHSTSAIDFTKFEKFCYDVAMSIDHINASFVFLPFGKRMPWDDRVSSGLVASRCKFWKKNIVIYNAISPQESLDVISASTLSISTRLHSTIFSCIAGTPFIDIVHNHKNKYFLETLNNYKFVLDYNGLNTRQLINMVDEIIDKRQNISSDLKTFDQQNKDILSKEILSVRFL